MRGAQFQLLPVRGERALRAPSRRTVLTRPKAQATSKRATQVCAQYTVRHLRQAVPWSVWRCRTQARQTLRERAALSAVRDWSEPDGAPSPLRHREQDAECVCCPGTWTIQYSGSRRNPCQREQSVVRFWQQPSSKCGVRREISLRCRASRTSSIDTQPGFPRYSRGPRLRRSQSQAM